MEKNMLSVSETMKDTVSIGLKNVPSLIGCAILYVLTIWIPYINLGTTIAMLTIPIELSKGNVISPLTIFDSKYRRYMGEFLIANLFISGGVAIASLFLLVPGIVIALSWSQALFFVLDKKMNPIEALTASNTVTYGNKWRIFGIQMLLLVILFILLVIASEIPYVGVFFAVIIMICLLPFILAMQSSIYRQLQANLPESTI